MSKKLRELRKAQDEGVDLAKRPLTVEQLMTGWLSKRAAVKKQASTLTGLHRRVRDHVVPAIGSVRVDQLQPAHIESWLEQEAEAGAARSTIRGRRADLRELSPGHRADA